MEVVTPITKAELRELRRQAILERGLGFKKNLQMDYQCDDLGEEETITVDENGQVQETKED